MKAVTDANFDEEVLKHENPVLVDYWAMWSDPCRRLDPILEEIDAEHGDKLKIVKLNVDENPEAMDRYPMESIPTMCIFSDGEIVKVIIGARPKSGLLRELADFI